MYSKDNEAVYDNFRETVGDFSELMSIACVETDVRNASGYQQFAMTISAKSLVGHLSPWTCNTFFCLSSFVVCVYV